MSVLDDALVRAVVVRRRDVDGLPAAHRPRPGLRGAPHPAVPRVERLRAPVVRSRRPDPHHEGVVRPAAGRGVELVGEAEVAERRASPVRPAWAGSDGSDDPSVGFASPPADGTAVVWGSEAGKVSARLVPATGATMKTALPTTSSMSRIATTAPATPSAARGAPRRGREVREPVEQHPLTEHERLAPCEEKRDDVAPDRVHGATAAAERPHGRAIRPGRGRAGAWNRRWRRNLACAWGHPTDARSPRSEEAGPSKRPSTVCGGSVTVPDLGLRNKFVTCATRAGRALAVSRLLRWGAPPARLAVVTRGRQSRTTPMRPARRPRCRVRSGSPWPGRRRRSRTGRRSRES